MVRKETDAEWTTIRIHKDTKKELLKHIIGRETDDDVLKRVLKMQEEKVVEIETSPKMKKYIEKLNSTKKRRVR